MACTSGKDRHVTCLDGQRPPLGSPEAHLAAAARDAENFVNARMVVNIVVDAVAPRRRTGANCSVTAFLSRSRMGRPKSSQRCDTSNRLSQNVRGLAGFLRCWQP